MNIFGKKPVYLQCKSFQRSIHTMEHTSETTAHRQTRFILITLLAIIIIFLVVSLLTCYEAVNAEVHARHVGIAHVASVKIEKTVKGMEMNAMNEFDEVEKHLDSPESVIAALKSKVDLNPEVRGYFAAFEPNYFPQEGIWFEPYIHHVDSGEFVIRQVGSPRHDYHRSDWYVRAKKSTNSFWSDPYYYFDGTNISGRYTTFVKPIYDKTGRLVCVCGADMTFEWLTKELQRIDDDSKNDDLRSRYSLFGHDDHFMVVINNDGSCIAYPEGKRLLLTKEQMNNSLMLKKSGSIDTKVNGVASTVYFAPIEHVDWMVAVVVTKQNIFKPLIVPFVILLLTTILGIILIFVLRNRLAKLQLFPH